MGVDIVEVIVNNIVYIAIFFVLLIGVIVLIVFACKRRAGANGRGIDGDSYIIYDKDGRSNRVKGGVHGGMSAVKVYLFRLILSLENLPAKCMSTKQEVEVPKKDIYMKYQGITNLKHLEKIFTMTKLNR